MENLFSDVDANATMFRVVCKSNLTRSLAEDLTERFVEVLIALDSLKDGYMSLHSLNQEVQAEAAENALADKVTMSEATSAALAAGKWLGKTRESIEARNEQQARPKPTRRRSVAHAVC